MLETIAFIILIWSLFLIVAIIIVKLPDLSNLPAVSEKSNGGIISFFNFSNRFLKNGFKNLFLITKENLKKIRKPREEENILSQEKKADFSSDYWKKIRKGE